MRYVRDRGLATTQDRRVWGMFGDGEMDEPEATAALTLAAREQLDNLTFVINCNLQRLDGPVSGNGQIIQELEALFKGAGWNVVKVLWGSDWDALCARQAPRAASSRLSQHGRRPVPESRRQGRRLQPSSFLPARSGATCAGRAHVHGEIDALKPRRARPAQAPRRVSVAPRLVAADPR